MAGFRSRWMIPRRWARGQRVGQVQPDLDDTGGGQPALLLEQPLQRPACDVLHDQVVPAVLLAGRDHVHDVGVVELAQRLALAQEAFEQVRVAGENVGGKRLDRDRFPGVRVGGAVDVAHAAAAEEVAFGVGDDETVGDHLARTHSLRTVTPLFSQQLARAFGIIGGAQALEDD